MVTPEWLIESNFKWEKCDENQFKLTKEYEYKHCAFHQEYNNQQKFTANVSNNKISADSTFLASTLKENNENLNAKFQKNESSHSLSNFETKSKKPKTVVEETKKNVTFDLDDDSESNSRDSNLINSLNEDIFQQMDKEVSP